MTRHEAPGDPAPRLTARNFHPEVLKLFDEYVHGATDRRGFLERAAKFAALGTSATALLEALSPKFAEARVVEPSDPRIQSELVELPSPKGTGKVRGLLVRPAKLAGKLPAVLVIHENRGLNPHIEDIARRVALEKFIAFAPDALSSLGGYPGEEDAARALFQKLDPAKAREDFAAAARFLKGHPASTGKLGAVGFCWGGGVVGYLATHVPELDAGVPFYGAPPALEEVPRIKAPLSIHLAETDERINTAWPAAEAKLESSRVKFELFRYPGTQHGFNNDTTPRYDEAAAKLAWQRAIAFFDRHLRSASAPAPASASSG